MAEDTHRENAHTVGTLTMTMTKVFFSASRKVSSFHRSMKFFRPTKFPRPWVFMLASVRLLTIQITMGMMTKPTKKIKLGSKNR